MTYVVLLQNARVMHVLADSFTHEGNGCYSFWEEIGEASELVVHIIGAVMVGDKNRINLSASL